MGFLQPPAVAARDSRLSLSPLHPPSLLSLSLSLSLSLPCPSLPSTGATRNERQEGGRGRRRATTHHCWSSTAAPPALCVAPPAVASPRSTPGGAGAAGRARRGHGSRCAAGAGARGETAQVRHGRGRRVPRRVRRVLRAHVRLHALVAATAAQHHRAPAPPRPHTSCSSPEPPEWSPRPRFTSGIVPCPSCPPQGNPAMPLC